MPSNLFGSYIILSALSAFGGAAVTWLFHRALNPGERNKKVVAAIDSTFHAPVVEEALAAGETIATEQLAAEEIRLTPKAGQ